MRERNTIQTCLWFNSGGFEAAKFYVSVIPDSILETSEPENSEPLMVSFSLGGVPYQILNGGPHYHLNPACSIVVVTPDQAETNRIWDALLSSGGSEQQCGWLVDGWGVSWQIYPSALPKMLGSPDREAAARAQKAMLKMTKIDTHVMQAAFDDA